MVAVSAGGRVSRHFAKCLEGVGRDGRRATTFRGMSAGMSCFGTGCHVRRGECAIIRGDGICGGYSRGVENRAGFGPGECRADGRAVGDGRRSGGWQLSRAGCRRVAGAAEALAG